MKRGWKRGTQQHSWTLDGRTIIVLHPDQARGLEFDGAVVVEPSEFPVNFGRQGVLYTSLTRANKELAIVHSKRLPKGLRLPRVKREAGRGGWISDASSLPPGNRG
jgi:DNA helicase-2/ATP-dependent DNA helicase PcrA